MRLMFIITRGDILGGAQSYVRDLARRFAADGDDVLVVTGAAGAMTEALAAAGVEVVTLPGLLREIDPINDPRAVAALTRLMRGRRPDLVSTHSSKAGIAGRIAARFAGVPAVFTVHGWAFNASEPLAKRTVYRALERACAPLASRIICVSEHARRFGIASGIPARRLVAIQNGIPDLPAHSRPERTGPPRAISVARFAPPKDHEMLVRAVAAVEGLQLDLVGDGPAEAAAREIANGLGIADRVRFLGRRDDVVELLAAADIFVLCSRSEGFPLSTLEAMRAGLPVVVSNVGGAPEAVVDRVSGYVVDNDVAVWTERLRMLADDAGRRAAMGRAGRARFDERFTFERMYAETAAVYRDAAGPARSRAPAPVQV